MRCPRSSCPARKCYQQEYDPTNEYNEENPRHVPTGLFMVRATGPGMVPFGFHLMQASSFRGKIHSVLEFEAERSESDFK